MLRIPIDKSLIMLNRILSVLSLLSYNSCAQTQGSLRGVVIEMKFPKVDTVVDNKWAVSDYNLNFTRVYYYSDLVMIQPSYISNNVEMINGVVVKETKEVQLYKTFVFSKELQTGILIDSNNVKTARLVNKDSVQKVEWVFKDIPSEILKENYIFLTSSQNEKDGKEIEFYSLVNKADSSVTGTLKFVFSRNSLIEPLPYHLSQTIEQKKKMRKIEIVLTINERNFNNGQPSLGKMEIPYKLFELKIGNRSELISIFEFAKLKMKTIK
jgi:hypothetical protein